MNAPAETLYPHLDLQQFIADGGVIIGMDVDTEGDFANEDGALYVPAAPEVRPNLERITDSIRIKIACVDSHSHDAWEFLANGGPFPEHCVKGTAGWLRIPETNKGPTRFIPMSNGGVVIGESKAGEGNREYNADFFASEVVDQGVTGIFEKEVYSMFANPNAAEFIEAIVQKLESERNITRDQILFAVYGYCTGGYCVDAAAEGLRERGYRTAIVEDATAPLNINNLGQPQDGAEVTRKTAAEKNIHIVTTDELIQAA